MSLLEKNKAIWMFYYYTILLYYTILYYTIILLFIGGTVSDTLQEATIKLFDETQCQSFYPDRTITPTMLCAGHLSGEMDACQVGPPSSSSPPPAPLSLSLSLSLSLPLSICIYVCLSFISFCPSLSLSFSLSHVSISLGLFCNTCFNESPYLHPWHLSHTI